MCRNTLSKWLAKRHHPSRHVFRVCSFHGVAYHPCFQNYQINKCIMRGNTQAVDISLLFFNLEDRTLNPETAVSDLTARHRCTSKATKDHLPTYYLISP